MRPTLPLTILTGASRGLGAAIAEQLLQRGATLLTMSRHPDPTLNAKAAETGAVLAFLAQPDFGTHPVADVRNY